MRKFSKYIIYALISLVALISLYCARPRIFVPLILKYIHTRTGRELKFDNFYILPFSLTLTNLKDDNVFAARKITFKINPLKFFKHNTSPIDCISKMNISKLEIYLNKDVNKKDTILSKVFIKLHKSEITAYADEIIIKKKSDTETCDILKIVDSDMLINHGKIVLNSVFYIQDIPIKINSQLEQKTKDLFTVSSVLTASNKINLNLYSEGTINFSSLNISQNIEIRQMLYKGFDFSDSSCSFSKSADNYNVNLTGDFGRFVFSSLENSVIDVKSEIDLSKINKNLAGNVRLKFNERHNNRDVELDITNLIILGFKYGNFKLSGIKNNDNIYNMSCIYGYNKKMEIVYTKGGKYEEKIIVKNKIVGVIKGDLKTGEIAVNINNANISDVPIIPFVGKDAKGIINVSGSIDEVSGQIDFICKNFSTSDTNHMNMRGAITRNKDIYAFNFYKEDNSIALNTVVKNGRIISTDFKFDEVDIANIMRACGYFKHNVSGIASGRIQYQKDSITVFDIKAFDGIFYNNKFKKFEAKGNINLNRINIERCILENNLGANIIDMTGLIGFAEGNPVSSLYINVSNANIGGVSVSGYTEFQGRLDKKNNINGVVKSSGIRVAGVSLGNIYADTVISTEKFEISNLKSDNGVEAFISAKFKENKLSGSFNLKNISIEGVCSEISGFLNSHMKLSGELNNPYIIISVSVVKGKYLTQSFSLTSELEYKDNIFKINKAIFIVDKTKILLQGRYFNGGCLSLTIDNLNENFINKFTGFKSPLEGEFSGSGDIYVKNGKYNAKAFLKAKSAYVKTVKLNDVKSNIEFSDDNIIISGASAKISDSEIRADKGFFNIKDGGYDLDLFLINAHVGPADIFGDVNLSGKMTKEKDGVVYNGNFKFNNLWINKYKLSSSCFDYSFKDKTFEFSQKSGDVNKYNSSGIVVFRDVISIKKLNVSKDKTFFNLYADFSKEFINLGITGSNIEWHFINDVFNLPDIFNGNVNIDAKLSGNIRSPKGKLSMVSTSGSVMDVPYDNFNVEIDFYNNRGYIKTASVFKRNEIRIVANGDFPLRFNKTTAEIKQKESVNIFYEIDDYKLNILKYLSNGYIKPYTGKIFFKGAVSGTYEKFNNDGNLSIIGGSFEAKEYLNKVKDISIEISLVKNLVKINKFNLKSGYGKLNAYGWIKLEKFKISDFDIRILTDKKGIPLRIPQLPISKFMGSESLFQDYSAGKPVFDIKIQGTPLKPKITGRIVLENTRFTYPGVKNSLDSYIPENTEFDLELTTAKNTKFENSFISSLINGSVYIKGTYNDIKVNGVVEALEGRIDYLGRGFDISSAKIEITEGNQVYITAEGKTIVSSKTGNDSEKLILKRSKISELSKLNALRFISKDNPNMDQQKSTATEQDKQLTSNSNFIMKQTALNLFNQNLTTPVRVILRKTGFDFRVSYVDTMYNDENLTLSNLLSGTKYSIEKNLTNQIIFGYSVTLDESVKKHGMRQEIEMKYKLMNNLFLSGSCEFKSKEGKGMLQYRLWFGPSTKK